MRRDVVGHRGETGREVKRERNAEEQRGERTKD